MKNDKYISLFKLNIVHLLIDHYEKSQEGGIKANTKKELILSFCLTWSQEELMLRFCLTCKQGCQQ